MNSNKRRFLIIISLIVITRLGDAMTTYLVTPDLQYELNPIVKILHWGWLGLGLVVAMITIVVIYFSYLHYLHPLDYRQLPISSLGSVSKFSAYISYGPNGRLVDFLFRMPKLNILARIIGYAGGCTIIMFGIYCIINNLLFINYASELTSIWVKLCLNTQLFHFVFIIFSMSIFTFLFYRNEFKKATIYFEKLN